ncbi:MAG: thiamine diphosphokinase [Bacillota bacterium]|nr:thiamine diphosphokinase [Bacillota bacterium]
MRALIMSGGTKPSRELALEETEKSSIIIGVDKGIEYLYEYNIKPDILLGDFDSINAELLETVVSSYNEVLKFPPEKDFTDTQAAINKCLELDAEEIVMLACTGCRLDHTMANIGLLYQCLKTGKTAYLIDDKNTMFMVDKNIELEGRSGGYFSLMAFGGDVEGLTIEGAKYPLRDYKLVPWDNITTSNEFCGCKVNIKFNSGNLLVFYSRD